MVMVIPSVAANESDLRLWAGAASAVATTAAVAVALFREPLRDYWTKPRLRILPFDRREADGVEMLSPDKTVEEVWVRLRIQNNGRRTARMVEVTIDGLVPIDVGAEAKTRDEQFRRQQDAANVGRQLKWADRATETIDIPARTSRRVDLFHLLTGEPRYITGNGEIAVPIRLTLFPPSKVAREILPALKYRVVVTIVGMNVRPVGYELDICFGGVWREKGGMWKGECGGVEVGEPRRIKVDGRRKM
jgi:hypothetical protein